MEDKDYFRLQRRAYDDQREAHNTADPNPILKDAARAYRNRLATIQRREAYFLCTMAGPDNLPGTCPPAIGVLAFKAAEVAKDETQWDHERKGYSLDERGRLIDAARDIIVVAYSDYQAHARTTKPTTAWSADK